MLRRLVRAVNMLHSVWGQPWVQGLRQKKKKRSPLPLLLPPPAPLSSAIACRRRHTPATVEAFVSARHCQGKRNLTMTVLKCRTALCVVVVVFAVAAVVCVAYAGPQSARGRGGAKSGWAENSSVPLL